jgi:hypothetical protein
LKTELVEELELLDAMVKQHLKSYQVWYVLIPFVGAGPCEPREEPAS